MPDKMNLTKSYVVQCNRMAEEKDFIYLSFNSEVVIDEKFLQYQVKQPKTSQPELLTFIRYMKEHCMNIHDTCKRAIQVYMTQPLASPQNCFLTNKYFTTGLLTVGLGVQHRILNHTLNKSLYVVCCNSGGIEQRKEKYLQMANSHKLLINESYIRNDFHIRNVQPVCILEENSIYFFYTETHSQFSIEVGLFDSNDDLPIKDQEKESSEGILTQKSYSLQQGVLSSSLNSFGYPYLKTPPDYDSQEVYVLHQKLKLSEEEIESLKKKVEEKDNQLQSVQSENTRLQTNLSHYKKENEHLRMIISEALFHLDNEK